jgi:hypothetical protein
MSLDFGQSEWKEGDPWGYFYSFFLFFLFFEPWHLEFLTKCTSALLQLEGQVKAAGREPDSGPRRPSLRYEICPAMLLQWMVFPAAAPNRCGTVLLYSPIPTCKDGSNIRTILDLT